MTLSSERPPENDSADVVEYVLARVNLGFGWDTQRALIRRVLATAAEFDAATTATATIREAAIQRVGDSPYGVGGSGWGRTVAFLHGRDAGVDAALTELRGRGGGVAGSAE